MKSRKRIFTALLISLFVSGQMLCYNTAAQIPSWYWVKSIGGNSGEAAACTTVDSFGNIIVGGTFGGATVSIGNTTLTNMSVGNSDILLTKFDGLGNVIWARSAGGTANDYIYDCHTDSNGNIIISGFFESNSITFGPGVVLTNFGISGTDGFIAKYDPAGNLLWARSGGGADGDKAIGCCIDAFNNIIVTGFFNSTTISFDSLSVGNSGVPTSDDFFMVKYDTDGNVIWLKSGSGTNAERAWKCACDGESNIIITGNLFGSSMMIDTITLTNAGWSDLFIAKFNQNGNVIWAKSEGSSYNESAAGIDIDNNGNIVITGTYESPSFTLGSTVLTNSGVLGTEDIFIVKYDSTGNVLWAVPAGGSSYDYIRGCNVDLNGNVIITGFFSSPSISFDTTVFNNTSSGNAMYIVKYSSTGSVLWGLAVNAYYSISGISCASDPSGNIITTGTFGNTSAAFGTTVLNSAGFNDLFIAKLTDFCTSTFSSVTAEACQSYISPSGHHTWNVSGIFSDTLLNASGCDSIININLTIHPLPVMTLTASGPTTFCQGDSVLLNANGPATSYQWYRNNNPITLATNADYTAKTAGRYYCIASDQFSCSDTTNTIRIRIPCIPIGPNGNKMEQEESFFIYPNPTNGLFEIDAPEGEIKVFNTFGQQILLNRYDDYTFDLSSHPDGIYFVQVNDGRRILTSKIMLKR